jgi:hypothetical protein
MWRAAAWTLMLCAAFDQGLSGVSLMMRKCVYSRHSFGMSQ